MIKITKRIEDFEIIIETDEPFSESALQVLLYEAFRKERVYPRETHQCVAPPEPSGLEK